MLLKFSLIFFLFLSTAIVVHGQKPSHLVNFFEAINTNNQDKSNELWRDLNEKGQPIVWNDSVYFFYEGAANSVLWNGDFNGWGGSPSFKNRVKKINETNIWYLKASFPSDARLDYKIVVDGRWIIDPNNEFRQYTGVGGGTPNSELRMPEWQPSEWIAKQAKNEGSLSDNFLIESESLCYTVNIKIYTPFGYDESKQYPVIYFTDGHEYTDQRLGASTQVINNLIEAEEITPVICVYVDPREVGNPSNNKRVQELVLNESYAEFISKELVAFVDSKYKTKTDIRDRGIFGTSLGGLFASYLHTCAPETFGLVGIQSPAYWYRMEILNMVNNSELNPEKVSMMCGTINDGQENAVKMKAIYESKGIDLQYFEVNQGHSWGSWKSALGEQLIFLLEKD